MSQGIQFIDIIFLGLVAGFLVLRLRSVLGRRSGSERPPTDPYAPRSREEQAREEARRDDNVIELPGRRGERPVADTSAEPQSPLDASITQIRLADPNFEPDTFLSGARMAFEMIVDAYAKGDSATLRPLLADDVYRNFDGAIRDRESRGETMETEIVALKGISIVGAEMRQRVASVTVRFVTEQTIVVRDAEGAIIEGNPNEADPVVDLWTFARDTANRDPNWQLVATETPEDEEEPSEDADITGGGDRT